MAESTTAPAKAVADVCRAEGHDNIHPVHTVEGVRVLTAGCKRCKTIFAVVILPAAAPRPEGVPYHG